MLLLTQLDGLTVRLNFEITIC